MKLDSWTVRFRAVAWFLFALTVIVILVMWAVWERDPQQVDGVLMWTASALAIGEGSNGIKRATFKREAVELDGGAG